MQRIEFGIKMGRVNVSVKDEIDSKFREKVFKRKGMRKGNLTKAIEEAMLLWIEVPTKDVEEIHKT